jgi:phosphate/sulfate permease
MATLQEQPPSASSMPSAAAAADHAARAAPPSGTSVGSKTLKLWSAMTLAGIFEFLGAFLLGGSVTSTIAGGIARTSTFASTPALFMFGKSSRPAES